jgi:hypothetical protein
VGAEIIRPCQADEVDGAIVGTLIAAFRRLARQPVPPLIP